MVSFLVRLRFAPEDRADRLPKTCGSWPRSRAANRAASPTFHTMWQDDPDTVLIYEQYRDEDALEAHRKSAHFKKYAIEGLFQKMRDRNIEDLIALL